MLSEQVKGRLLNWKFESARRMLLSEHYGAPGASDPTDMEQETILSLAAVFGNSGWFDGQLSGVVRAAVWYLGVFDLADEPHGSGR